MNQARSGKAGTTQEKDLRVLIVHNAYKERGGEDAVVSSEFDLLVGKGHAVEIYSRHNDELGAVPNIANAIDSLWSRRSSREIGLVISRFKPDVIHVHNILPLISPSIYWRAARLQVPVVQTLHNFRLLCPQAQLLRGGVVCEDCIGHLPWRAVAHACYRNSRLQSAVSASSISLHRAIGTYERHVARYIALNNFCRNKFVAGGLPAGKICVKPNFVDLGSSEADASTARCGGLFVGRLSADKGLAVLLGAAELYPGIRSVIAGVGELAPLLVGRRGFDCVGYKPLPDIFRLMTASKYLLVPSIWYENFPRTIIEAYACGLPVIASRLGALAEVVVEGRTGLLFQPGSATDLAATVRWADENPDEMLRMGQNARAEYERLYSPQKNYELLMRIYVEAVNS